MSSADALNWEKVSLGEVVTLQRGFDLPNRDRREGRVPIVSSSGVTGFHDVAKVEPPGVVTGRYGTLGEVFYVEEPFWPLNTTLYVKDFKGNDPKWVASLLRTMALGRHSGAAAVPGVNRNVLHQIPVLRPPLQIQGRIASVLHAYDEIIENNTRRIEILEEIAQAIYREWFVKFRYPGHEDFPLVDSDLGPIPEGWTRHPLFELAEVSFGYPFKSELFRIDGLGTPVIRIRDIPPNSTATTTTEIADEYYHVRDGDLLIGMDGEFHMGKWAAGHAYLNQRVTRLRPLGALSRYYLHLALRRPITELNRSIVGTTVAHLGKMHLQRLTVLMPTRSVAEAASLVLEPMFELEISLRRANRALRATRDLLLPRLISGELDVSELGIDVGELAS